MKEKITIYTNETCPYCKEIKKALNKEEIKFKEVNVSKETEEWEKVQVITGMPMLPTIVHFDRYFCPGRDYMNPEHLINLLKTYKKVKNDFNKLSYEHIRTLNYNIHGAFGRLNNSLEKINSLLETLAPYLTEKDKIITKPLEKEENEHESTS